MKYVCKNSVKFHGEYQDAGTVLEMSPEEAAPILAAGALEPVAEGKIEASQGKPEASRSFGAALADEKKAAPPAVSEKKKEKPFFGKHSKK